MMRLSIILCLLLLGAACSVSPKNKSKTKKMPLKLEIEWIDRSDTAKPSATIRLKLSNTSSQAVLINKRLAPGFEGQPSRELYFKIVDRQSGEAPAMETMDINRDDPEASDYDWLAAGADVQRVFDFYVHHPILPSGAYQLIAYYQADEDFPARPQEVLRGIVESEPIDILIP